MREKTYRFNKASGIIHYIPRCCCSGKARNSISYKDNYEESYTYEEAVNVLKSRCVQAFNARNVTGPKKKICNISCGGIYNEKDSWYLSGSNDDGFCIFYCNR